MDIVSAPTSPRSNEETTCSRDDVFTILSNRRRRYALHACKCAETPIELSDLAEQVAAWEYEKDRQELQSDERRRVYTAMQQTHLPTMEKAGVIEYEDQTIELTERAEDLDIYMDVVPGNSIPWGEYYLGLSGVSAALIASAWMGVYPVSVPDLAWAGLIVTAFLLSALFHVFRSRQMRLGGDDAPAEVEG